MDFQDKLVNGPIPGENYTTDTKNFPWHRPPQYTHPDDAIEYAIKWILDDERSDGYMTMLEIGWSIVDVTQMFIMNGVGKGLWTFDMGLIIAGPVSHLLVIMARGYDIDFDLGIKKEDTAKTANLFKQMSKDNEAIVSALNQVLDPEDNDDDEEIEGGEDQQTQPSPEPTPEAAQAPQTGLGGAPAPSGAPEQGMM